MCKKEKHCWALSRILFISVQLIVFLDHVLLPAELAQKFKLLQIGTSGDLPLIIHVPNLQAENLELQY